MEDLSYEKICMCALNMTLGHKPAVIKKLLSVLHSAAAVFNLDDDGKNQVFGPYSPIRDNINMNAVDKAEKELRMAENIGCRFIGCNEKSYPSLLSECEDSPAGLYVKSTIPDEDLFSGDDFIAIVGTRSVSSYGKTICKEIVQSLSCLDIKPVIVSGLAFGTDITAHREAVECGLRTIAVLPGGVDKIYPVYHAGFAEYIAKNGKGAIVSDYPFGTIVHKGNFLRRNRIIAGLGKATILIESKSRGGGIITAHHAFSYSRDVYVVPGRFGDKNSEGCNILLANGIASPIVSYDRLTDALGYKKQLKRNDTLESLSMRYRPEISDRATAIIRDISYNDGMTLHQIATQTKLAYSEVASIAGILEADGFISIDMSQRCSLVKKNL